MEAPLLVSVIEKEESHGEKARSINLPPARFSMVESRPEGRVIHDVVSG
jgi:hypothetical protein